MGAVIGGGHTDQRMENVHRYYEETEEAAFQDQIPYPVVDNQHLEKALRKKGVKSDDMHGLFFVNLGRSFRGFFHTHEVLICDLVSEKDVKFIRIVTDRECFNKHLRKRDGLVNIKDALSSQPQIVRLENAPGPETFFPGMQTSDGMRYTFSLLTLGYRGWWATENMQGQPEGPEAEVWECKPGISKYSGNKPIVTFYHLLPYNNRIAWTYFLLAESAANEFENIVQPDKIMV